MSFRTLAVAAASLLALAGTATPSTAFDLFKHLENHAKIVSPTERISFADLNIETDAGAHAFLARVKVAAKRVCGPEPAITFLADFAGYKRCMKDAQDKAIAMIDKPVITAMYSGEVAPEGLTASTPH